MAISKVILNGETLMDVTSDTVEADKLLSGETATKNDGTKVTGAYAVKLQSKSVTPTESSQTVTPDTGYDAMSQVTVGAISSTYVGSAIPMRSAANMYANGSKVYAPSGYYSTTANAAVSSTSLSDITMAIISSMGNVTAEISYSVGYLTAGGTKTEHKTLPVLSASTWTPGTTSQIISSYRWLTGSQTIAAIPSDYLIPSGTYSISSNGTYDIGSYQSVDISVEGGGGSGDGYTVDQIAMRTISGAISGEATTINSSAFCGFSALTEASFPSCTSIGNGAFYDCSALSSISFPSCTTIGNSAFYACSALTEVSFPSCTSIAAGAFIRCSALSSISFPACTYIGNAAFQHCYSLTEVNFSKCTNIYFNTFANCSALTSISFPSCTTIGNSAFYSCRSLTEASFPLCTSIGTSAFNGCHDLSSISFPLCTSIGSGAFAGCYTLTEASFPSCTILSSSAFAFCYALSSISFPLCTSIGNGAFYACSALTEVSFPSCNSIGGNVFFACNNFLSLYLLGSSLAKLSNTNAFGNTPISNNTIPTGGVYGSVFVPASLYDSYINATNWSVYSARIVGLTDEEIAALG